jgi:inosine-uridine nucleoside N-ribohydrolase
VRTYAQLDEANLVDNKEALQALLNTGIEKVALDEGEVTEIRVILRQSNRELAEQGEYSIDLYEQMLQYVQEYRANTKVAAGK